MGFILSRIIFSVLGRGYLFLKYLSHEKMIQIRDKDFDGSYSNVGKIISLKFVLIVFIVLLLGFIGVAIIGTIKNN